MLDSVVIVDDATVVEMLPVNQRINPIAAIAEARVIWERDSPRRSASRRPKGVEHLKWIRALLDHEQRQQMRDLLPEVRRERAPRTSG